MRLRQWTDALGEERPDKTIRVEADADGITIIATYDGGYEIDLDARLTWGQLAALRADAEAEA